jgi:hypothetical protein
MNENRFAFWMYSAMTGADFVALSQLVTRDQMTEMHVYAAMHFALALPALAGAAVASGWVFGQGKWWDRSVALVRWLGTAAFFGGCIWMMIALDRRAAGMFCFSLIIVLALLLMPAVLRLYAPK